MRKPSNPKERNLIKGSLRRVFSRSELRKEALLKSVIDYTDLSRPRVKKWSRCSLCLRPTPTYLIEIDHEVPIIPVELSLEQMSWDDVVDRIWCDIFNLVPLCKECHRNKTALENKLRRELKKKGTL